MDHSSPEGLPADASWPSEAHLLADMRWLGEIAARIVRDPGLAEDACQEAWLSAWSAGRGGATRADLMRGARRFVHNAWRGERRRQEREREVALGEALPSMQDLLEVREQQERLWSELLRLEEPLRTVLVLKYRSSLSTAQIAERTGVAQDTVRWRLRRGTAALRERLVEEREGGDVPAIAAALPVALGQGPTLHAGTYTGAVRLALLKTLFAGWIVSKWTPVAAVALIALLATWAIELNSSSGAEPVPGGVGGAALEVAGRSAPDPPPGSSQLGDPGAQRAAVGALEPRDVEAAEEPAFNAAEDAQPALLRLRISPTEGAPLPRGMEVQVAPYFEPFGITGYPATAQFERFSGTVEVPLIVSGDMSDFMSGPSEFPTRGVVTVTAEGFGIQGSGAVDIGWRDGDVTDLTLTLVPARTVKVVAVHAGTRSRVEGAKIYIQGPGASFGSMYTTESGGPLTLALGREGPREDRLYVGGDGVAVRRYTTAEVLALPVLSDGLRELELSAGQTLRGSVELESGLALPGDAELRYQVLQPGIAGGVEPFPILFRQEGACPIGEHGRFELRGLPAGSVLLHLREAGKFVFETRRLGPDWRFEVEGVGESEVTLQVPSDPWTATLRVTLADGAPWTDSTLLAASLYDLRGDADGPYAHPASSRPLVARLHSFRSGEDVELMLPAGTIENGRPYLLALGANPTSCIERLVTFEGSAPRVEWTLTAAERDEAPPSASRTSTPSAEESERRRTAQEAATGILLRAGTPAIAGD